VISLGLKLRVQHYLYVHRQLLTCFLMLAFSNKNVIINTI